MSAAVRTFQRLTFFGTSSGVPTPFRNVSSYCMSFTDGAVWMIDCGEGTQHRLQDSRNTFVSSGRIERIFLTHLHGDHSFGLPGLMCTVSTMWGGNKRQPSQAAIKDATAAAASAAIAKSSAPALAAAAAAAAAPKDDDDDASDEEGPPHTFLPFSAASQYFELVGPQGTAEFIRTSLKLSESFMQYRYRVTELLPVGAPSPAAVDPSQLHPCEAIPVAVYPNAEGVYENFVFRQAPSAGSAGDTVGNVVPTTAAELAAAALPAAVGGLTVKAVPLTHRVFCLGYSVTEPALPGTLDMATCTALGVPKGPLLSQLKQGKTVSFPDPKDKTVTITVAPEQVVGAPIQGRTALLLGDTCDSTETHKIAQGCDLVVHESTFDDGSAHLAVDRGHSTSRMAAKFACELEAKQLVLTHFSARFVPPSKDPGPMAALLAQAEDEVRQYGVANPQAAGKGPSVITVEDFTSIDLQSRSKK